MRPLSPEFKAAMVQGRVRVALLAEIMYPTPVRMWTGIGDLAWNSHTWTGVGVFGGISSIQERGGALAGTVTLKLSAIPSEFLALAMGDANQGCRVSVWLSLFDENWDVIGNPWRAVRGKTDVHRINVGGKSGDISVTVITPMTGLKRPRVRLWTDADQQRHHPGDKFFEHGASMAERPLYWGLPGQGVTVPQYGGGEPPSGDGSTDYI